MNILEKQDYQRLLDFAKELNPTQIAFQEKTIQLMLRYFDFSGAAFPIVDDYGYYHRLAYANFSQLSMDRYDRYCYEKDFFAPANYSKHLEKNVLMVDDFMTFDEYEASALYNEVLSQNNFYYEALVLLRGEQGEYIGAVAVYHEKDSTGFTEKERYLLEEIGCIIEKAFRIYLNLYEKNTQAATLECLLYRLPIGMILCDSHFHILQVNREAIHIVKLLTGEASGSGIEKWVKDQVLPTHLGSRQNRYYLEGKIHLEIVIEHLITQNPDENEYATNYVLFLQYKNENKDYKWMDFLKSKGITEREREIAELLRRGYSLLDIAEHLKISSNTVKRHKESIYRKLEISRINQLNILYEKE